MRLWQLADDHEAYGDRAGWWIVVSDDCEDELAGPYKYDWQARAWINRERRRARRELAIVAASLAAFWAALVWVIP